MSITIWGHANRKGKRLWGRSRVFFPDTRTLSSALARLGSPRKVERSEPLTGWLTGVATLRGADGTWSIDSPNDFPVSTVASFAVRRPDQKMVLSGNTTVLTKTLRQLHRRQREWCRHDDVGVNQRRKGIDFSRIFSRDYRLPSALRYWTQNRNEIESPMLRKLIN